MGFFKKLFKVATKVLPVVAGYALGGPAGAAIGGGLGSAARGGDIRQILGGAAMGYGAGGLLNAGTAALGAYGGAPAVGTIGPQAGGIGSGLSSLAGSAQSALMSPAALALRSAQMLMPQQEQIASQNMYGNGSAIAPDAPISRPATMERPSSLNDLAGLAPEQERAALATRGINTGLGSNENAYYRNLIQRSLIGDGNKVDTTNSSFLSPIESQYFSGQGKNTSDIIKFLQGIRA